MPPPVFVVLAGAMVIAALAILVLPLTRGEDSAPVSAGVVVALLPLTAAILYFSWSNWRWDQSAIPAVAAAHDDAAAPSIEQAVVQLEARLQAVPDDAEGWLMLGRSYVVMGRFPDAVDAYGRARQLGNDTDVHAITGYAEALAMARGGVIDDEAAALFEQALTIAPNDTKALWYGGLAALESGRPRQARDRWQRLLAAGPPEEVASVLREQIAAADAMLGGATTAPAEVPVAADGLSLHVSLTSELAARVGPNVPVFILARQVDMPGPPLAVVRKTVADLPVRVVLSDADAMVPGRVLSAHPSVEVVARVAIGGTPAAQPGDFAGSRVVASSGQAAIIIDSVVSP
ncbi:MAG: tetratricopeptide repeat protein [Gammaproteobacteria bacterium]|nr:tetratricopeptide repeat protein [Gammaproteobacteria bacterium]NNF60443.1 tetratricopeptide repeat protein [Gammaproteobacteria bacterium]NNM21789.1 tetratricopeptide repeat protein [Gammaproteobacteria bacterium]